MPWLELHHHSFVFFSPQVYVWHGLALLTYYAVFVVTVIYSREEEKLDSYGNLLDSHPRHSVFLERNSSER